MKVCKHRSLFGLALLLFALTACSGGGGTHAPAAPSPSLSYGIKQLQFTWPAVNGADYYRLYENTDGASGFAQVGGDITATSINHDIALYLRVNAQYIVAACNRVGCSDSTPLSLATNLLPAIGYVKASNTAAGDFFGDPLALSGDGTTLAVAAAGEDSNANGINGDQNNNSASSAGAVYLFVRDGGGSWSQQAYIKASNPGAGDSFGYSLALSDDGDTLAVGAALESSAATGINGNEADNSAVASGAVYVFTRNADIWTQQAYIKASNTDASDLFGGAVALSSDGNTLAVGAHAEASNATYVNGDQTDNSAGFAGAVYVFTRTSGVWSQQAYIKAITTGADYFGSDLALSDDGNTLAVGAPREDSAIASNPNDNSFSDAGAVYLYYRSAGVWTLFHYIKASNPGVDDWFGNVVALSGDGNTLAIGASNEDSSATGIGGDQTDNAAANAGVVYLYARDNLGLWPLQAYIKASNTGSNDAFGSALVLSQNGDILAVGAYGEGSNGLGVESEQNNETLLFSGASYLFTRNSGVWTQQAYIKASNTGADDSFGNALALSDDGNTLAVGAGAEDGGAAGLGGDQNSNTAALAGAAYLY